MIPLITEVVNVYFKVMFLIFVKNLKILIFRRPRWFTNKFGVGLSVNPNFKISEKVERMEGRLGFGVRGDCMGRQSPLTGRGYCLV